MTSTALVPRPAALALRATYRADGVVLLELIEDWYTSLGAAAVLVGDAGQVRDVLTDWALRPTSQRSTRHASRGTSAETSPPSEATSLTRLEET